MRADQLLSRFGHATRREAVRWIKAGRLREGDRVVRAVSDHVDPGLALVDGEPLEAPHGLLALFHKPAGCVCSHNAGEGRTIYDLLPARWARRNPPVTSVGRLDKETTGLLLLTDLGPLVHLWTAPRRTVPKVYEVKVDRPLDPAWIGAFKSGTLMLDGEDKPCLPATLRIVGERAACVELTEGRYHQVRRMFAAVGATVLALHRSRFGPFTVDGLEIGAWRMLDPRMHDGTGPGPACHATADAPPHPPRESAFQTGPHGHHGRS